MPTRLQKWAAHFGDTGTTKTRTDEDGDAPPTPVNLEWASKLAAFREFPPVVMGAAGAPAPFMPPRNSVSGRARGEFGHPVSHSSTEVGNSSTRADVAPADVEASLTDCDVDMNSGAGSGGDRGASTTRGRGRGGGGEQKGHGL